jgi:hypothetical protein
MALLGSSLQGRLSGFQFLVHLDQDKNQGTPSPPGKLRVSRGPSEGDSRAGPQGRSLVIPEITPEGGSFQFFSFSVPLGLTETKN